MNPKIVRAIATMKDVAKVAGLSKTTVSRHLNGQLKLPAATVARIQEAIRELGYHPNSTARRLSSGRTEMIGFVTADIGAPFFAEIASAAEEEAYRHGYHIVICNTRNEIDRELSYLQKLQSRFVDGLIFLTNHAKDERLREAISRCKHVVLVDEDVEGVPMPKVFADNVRGAYDAIRYTIAQGHTRIGFVTGAPGMLSAEERHQGYRKALKEANLPYAPELTVFGDYTNMHAIQAFDRLRSLPDPPTALLVTSDLMALEIMRHARVLGIAIPRDLSIIGFDDIPAASLVEPPLTTVRQPTKMFGQVAVRLLLELLRKSRPKVRTERLPVELCVRGSVGPPKRKPGRQHSDKTVRIASSTREALSIVQPDRRRL